MPKVNFYLLKQNTVAARAALCCKLAEQQMRQGQRVFVLTASMDDARDIDQLLWSFMAESFVPHALADDESALSAPVVIGTGALPDGIRCVLNLGDEPLAATDGLGAIAEFVLNDEQAKAASRQRWQHYKQLGCELQLHQL